jgi:hypothetical protein
VQEQAAVGTDRRAAKRELRRAVELQPQRASLRFTRRVRRRHADPSLSTRCYREDITLQRESKAQSIWDIRVAFLSVLAPPHTRGSTFLGNVEPEALGSVRKGIVQRTPENHRNIYRTVCLR